MITISETMLKRAAESLRFHMTGEGGLDEHRWAAVYCPSDDQLRLMFKADRSVLEISGNALSMSLDYISEKYLEPFVRNLPCVIESAKAKAELARVRGNVEYISWDTAFLTAP